MSNRFMSPLRDAPPARRSRMRRPAAASRDVLVVIALLLVTAGGCRRPPSPEPGEASGDAPARGPVAAAGESPGGSSRAVARPRVVVLGDSLTAGYGLPSKDEAFPARLQLKVDEAGLGFEVVNMGVSGDTSAGGLSRLDWALVGEVRVLVIALGANDGLRGLGAGQMSENLAAIIDRASRRGIAVLLCGMEAPPNLGVRYTREFRDAYRDLARARRVEFLPFLLEGVAGRPDMNQSDGIHPNPAGAARMADLVWDKLRPMLEAGSAS